MSSVSISLPDEQHYQSLKWRQHFSVYVVKEIEDTVEKIETETETEIETEIINGKQLMFNFLKELYPLSTSTLEDFMENGDPFLKKYFLKIVAELYF